MRLRRHERELRPRPRDAHPLRAPGGRRGDDGGGAPPGHRRRRLRRSRKSADVFVTATANDLSALPPELLRKGRFDEIFFVDLPTDTERREILRIHLDLRKQDPSAFDLERLVEVSEGFSGAELEQVVIGALYRALHEKRRLETDLLVEEVRGTVPLSVSRAEEIRHLRERARGRFVPVA